MEEKEKDVFWVLEEKEKDVFCVKCFGVSEPI